MQEMAETHDDECPPASLLILQELRALRLENAQLHSQLSALQSHLQPLQQTTSNPTPPPNPPPPSAPLESATQHEGTLQAGSASTAQAKEDLRCSQASSAPVEEVHGNYDGIGCCRRMGNVGNLQQVHNLDPYSISRYSRQLLVPSFGVKGQENLSKSSILIIGAGGLGSPAALYLAAAGLGCLGLVDHDVVELDNLHRQVIHTEGTIGESKVKSAARACRAINSFLQVHEHGSGLKPSNALDIIKKYAIIVDATDNLPTRYLINDACVLLDKPLVSGAALGTDGQLTVYHHNNGPCYRCLFPIPPPPDACQSCSDAGVLGIVPGIIGCLQALEAIKLASKCGEPLSGRLLHFDALTSSVHSVKLRGRSSSCIVCGDSPQILIENLHQFDYEGFTGSIMCDKVPQRKQIIPPTYGVSCREYKRRCDDGESHVLLDVRAKHQYDISALPNSVNIPLTQLKNNISRIQDLAKVQSQSPQPIYVVCRRGNDSQIAVQFLRNNGLINTFDVVGGLESWTSEVDIFFPRY